MAILLNAPADKLRDSLVADVLIQDGWTAAELIQARTIIAKTPELAKEASYAGAITPALFTMARPYMTKPDTRWCVECGAMSKHRGSEKCFDCLGMTRAEAA